MVGLSNQNRKDRAMNNVILYGHLGSDIEIRSTRSGLSVANVSLATNERRKENGEWGNATEWHRLVLWGKTAELAAEYTHKGSKLLIRGRLQTREWEDKEGKKVHTTEIVVENMEFGPRAETDTGPAPSSHPAEPGGVHHPEPAPSKSTGGPASPEPPAPDDDLPF